MNESGQVTWTAPSHNVIKPGEEFSLQLSVQHTGSVDKEPGTNWMAVAQVFLLNDENQQKGSASYLTDLEGKSDFTTGPGNNFEAFSPTVFGTFGSGYEEGERMAIRVSASGGGVAVQTYYIYEWKPGS